MRNDTPQARFNLIGAVMVGVLGISVAMAWVATWSQKDSAYSGADLISKLRSDSLERYWPLVSTERWMIGVASPTTPVGWEMLSSRPDPQGGFSGQQVAGAETVSHKSNWTLSSDLSRGDYTSVVFDKNDKELAKTRITLSDIQISIVRQAGQKQTSASSARPKNYVPEGALSLVLSLVAQRGQAVTVKMIFDEYSIASKKIRFADVRLIPLGGNVVRMEGVLRGLPRTASYHIDSQHNISRLEYVRSGLFYRECEKETVEDIYGLFNETPTITTQP